MRVLQSYKSRKFLLRMLLSVTFFMVVILSLSSAVLYYSSESRVVQMQQEANRKVMSQISHNIAFMQEIVRNAALTIYNDNQIVAPLMSYHPKEDIDVINAIRLLGKAQRVSAFLHSVMIYNGHLDEIYAEGALAPALPDDYMAEAIVKILEVERKLPQMQLLPMNISGRDHEVDFFSMVVYETFSERNHQEGALVLNVKPEWIMDNLKVVNDFAAPDRSGIFILDESGKVIFTGDERNVPDPDGISAALADERLSGIGGFGSFSHVFPKSGKYMVTYMDTGVGNWTVVTVQPYDAVLGGLLEMRMASIWVIVSFLALSVIVSVLLSHKLYQPVEAMLNRIRKESGESGLKTDGAVPVKDELSLVTHIYSDMARKLDLVMNEQDQQKSIVRNYQLRSLLADSTAMSDASFADIVLRNELRIDLNGPYQAVVVKIDEYADFLARTSHAERLLYAFAISNIAEEILAPGGYRCETADMKSDHLAIIVSGGSADPDPDAVALQLVKIQDIVMQYYRLSVTMSVSGPFKRREELSERYGKALQQSVYKFVFGKRTIITPDMVSKNEANEEYSFPAELEKKLVEAIRTNEFDAMTATVEQLINRMSAHQYDHIVIGILHAVDLIKTTLREIGKNRVAPISLDISDLNRRVLERETLAEIAELLHQVCRDIHERLHSSEQDKNAALMDAIREIVESNYQDVNLSLQGIASMLKMTPAYVGRIFKQNEWKSVGEYINEVRLTHARELLETKSFSIKEIMELAGYMNESTFFKLFKKKYGVTPREYRLKRNIG
jgi:AraC-like DNA-binding protein